MLKSVQTIPQLTNFDDADITELEQWRKESSADYEKEKIKLTSLAFVIKAVALSLKEHSTRQRIARPGERPDHIQALREHRRRR